MSTVKATHFEHPSASTPGITLASDGSVVLPSGFTGGIGTNVVQTVKTDTFSTTSTGAWVDITGLTATITPSNATSKVLVLFSVNLSCSSAGNNSKARLIRDSTAVYIGTGATTFDISAIGGSNTDVVYGMTGVLLDSPATTSAVTYKMEMRTTGGTGYLNRRGITNADVMPSNITLVEVAA